jgi:hypothetical protein
VTVFDEQLGGAGSVADPVERVAAALRTHNIEAIVVETGEEARNVVLGLIPELAEVHSGKSKTLDEVGLHAALMESGRYDALRPLLILGEWQPGRTTVVLVREPVGV